jgi:aromatic ring-opening dioxygenase catalytic subunit (LigB family)
MPAVYLPHGGGPWPFMAGGAFGPPAMWRGLRAYLEGLSSLPSATPKCLLVISAHWEETLPTVMSGSNPPMLYDYQGFPPETYRLQWPAPGAPELAERVANLLAAAGIESRLNDVRGFDHGVFVPLMLAYPEAQIPTIQLSLKQGLDPAEHLAYGRALAPLRDEGVFLIGSGMSYHNMHGFMSSMHGEYGAIEEDSKDFDNWLAESMLLEPEERDARLIAWRKAPAARACHPREEHLLPLMVIAGAAAGDQGTIAYRDQLMNAYVSAVHFGC